MRCLLDAAAMQVWRRAGGNSSIRAYIYSQAHSPGKHELYVTLRNPRRRSSESLWRPSLVHSSASTNHRLKYALHPQDKTGIRATPPPAATTSPTHCYPLNLSLLIFMTVAGSMLLLARGAQGPTVAAALRGGAVSCFVPLLYSTSHSMRLPVRPLRVRNRVVWTCQTQADAHRLPPSSPSLPPFPPRRIFPPSRV